MKKEENVKNKLDKSKIFTKVMAGFLAVVMVLATCSTLIYYIVSNV